MHIFHDMIASSISGIGVEKRFASQGGALLKNICVKLCALLPNARIVHSSSKYIIESAWVLCNVGIYDIIIV